MTGLTGRGLKCPNIDNDYWICPDGLKIKMIDLLKTSNRVNQSELIEKIEQKCQNSFRPYCTSLKRSYLELYREGGCSGGAAGDIADLAYAAAW